VAVEKTKSYKDLVVYQKAYELALEIYRVTENFPKQEIYGLTSQIRRAAISIPSNIAEGYQRGSRKEYVQFLNIAYGSAAELETQLSLAGDLKLLSEDDYEKSLDLWRDVSKLLFTVVRSLKQKV
jgi:four helix bundle protein